jgi:RNA polymerase sigma-70 factor, ECF subfamily
LARINEIQVVGSSIDAERTFRRHYAHVFRYLRRRTQTSEQAEDLTQTVFADLSAALERFKPGDTPVLGLLYTVAQRRLVDEARRASRAPGEVVSLEHARAERASATDYGPAVARAIGAAIASLPSEQRRVVVMKLLEGRRVAEIAHALETTEGACWMRLQRGLQAVRDQLEKEGITP